MKLKINKKTAWIFVGVTAAAATAYLIIRKRRKNADRAASQAIASGTSPEKAGLTTTTQSGTKKNTIFPIEYGDRGTSVRMLQQCLNDLYGAGLQVDGIFGKKTLAACKQYLGVEKVTSALAVELTIKQTKQLQTVEGKLVQPGLPDSFI